MKRIKRKYSTFLEWMCYIKHNDYALLEGNCQTKNQKQ